MSDDNMRVSDIVSLFFRFYGCTNHPVKLPYIQPLGISYFLGSLVLVCTGVDPRYIIGEKIYLGWYLGILVSNDSFSTQISTSFIFMVVANVIHYLAIDIFRCVGQAESYEDTAGQSSRRIGGSYTARIIAFFLPLLMILYNSDPCLFSILLPVCGQELAPQQPALTTTIAPETTTTASPTTTTVPPTKLPGMCGQGKPIAVQLFNCAGCSSQSDITLVPREGGAQHISVRDVEVISPGEWLIPIVNGSKNLPAAQVGEDGKFKFEIIDEMYRGFIPVNILKITDGRVRDLLDSGKISEVNQLLDLINESGEKKNHGGSPRLRGGLAQDFVMLFDVKVCVKPQASIGVFGGPATENNEASTSNYVSGIIATK